MKRMEEKYWRLLAKHLAGECNAEENKRVLFWLNKKPENQRILEQLKNDQLIMEKYNHKIKVDTDAAWKKVMSRIESDITKNKSDKPEYFIPIKRRFINIYRVAAAIILLTGLFMLFQYVLKNKTGNENLISVTASGKDTKVLLPDGSMVYLNQKAGLYYPDGFDGNFREVTVKGEAFFEVVHDPSKPFRVNAGNAMITVIGTSFLVKTDATDQVEVYVETGKVNLSNKEKKDTGIIIQPGYIGKIKRNSITTAENKNENILAWKTKRMIFKNMNFTEVTKILEDVYGVEIEIKTKSIADCRFTSTSAIENQPIDTVINILSATLNLSATRDKEKIIFSGKGCNY